MKSAVRLTDIQLILLATAAQREDGSLLPPPDALRDGPARMRKAVEALICRGLAQEVPIKKSADAWRNEGRRSIGVVITDAGRAAIGVEGDAPEEGGALTPALVTSPTISPPLPEQLADADRALGSPGAHTKTALVVAMLRRESGATLDELNGATSWLPHTTRAALTGLRKKGHVIDKRKRGAVTCYHLGSPA